MLVKIKFLLLVFFIFFLALIARLTYWQAVKGYELSRQAKLQYNSSRVIAAPRGNILASDGSFLAFGSQVWKVVANPQAVKESPKEVSEELAPFFVEDIEDRAALLIEIDRLTTLLSSKDLVWTLLKSKVSTDVKKEIEGLGITGITFEEEEARFYPEASVGAQLLGFVGKSDSGEDTGYFGLEGYYNLSLSGKSGFVGREKDAAGIPILIGGSREVSAVSGVDLVTSIDKRIQLIVYEKLVEGINGYGAKGGTVIVANPKTGEILAMESYPSYDPSKYWDFGDTFFKNPSISDAFEPGSIFKVLVMASGIDAKAVEPDTKCDICSGPVKVDKYLIETWNKEYREDSTMTDVLVHSDNVGMTFIAQKLGIDVLYDYLSKFGIGKTTGIDLQGEASPTLRKKGTWNIVDLATASFGQGVAVTPIQMIRAVSAIANGGILPNMRVVSGIKGDDWEEKGGVPEGERVISEETAHKVSAMMVEAARHGEAQWTSLKGFKVAGKTGTAQIPIAGHYDPEKTNASFIGFAPSDNPEFIMLVALREPQTSPWASETAAPLWYQIAKEIFPYLGISPE